MLYDPLVSPTSRHTLPQDEMNRLLVVYAQVDRIDAALMAHGRDGSTPVAGGGTHHPAAVGGGGGGVGRCLLNFNDKAHETIHV